MSCGIPCSGCGAMTDEADLEYYTVHCACQAESQLPCEHGYCEACMKEEEPDFKSQVIETLGECVGLLPAGETWAATEDGVLMYLRDIVNHVNASEA